MNQSRNEEIVQTQGLARRRVWPAWVILVAAIIITILATFYMKSDVDVLAKREFIFACNEIRGKIDERLQAHETILLAGAALFDASDQVTREQWKTFVQRLNVESNLPGIQGIGFALRIPPDRLVQHIKDIRSEGFPNYDVRPEGDRDVYSSIIYLEPFLGRNLRAFGYDMLSEPVRRSAMERARDHNEAFLSGKVVLVQETDKDIQAGTLMYVPVYRKGMPTGTVEQRREALFGWVYSPYRMTDLMRGILGGWDSQEGLRIRLQVYDGTLLSSDAILYDSQAANDMGLAPQFTEDLQVVFNGSLWTLRFIQAGGQVSLARVWFTLASGMIISLLLFLLTLSLLNSRFNALQMAERLTTELRASEERWQFALEGARDGVWDWNAQTNEVFFSRLWKVMLGYEEHEIGTTLDEWDKRVHPDDKESCYADLERHFSGETPFYQNEHRVLCKDGNYKWILDRGKVMELMDDGKPLRVIGTHTDITERKRLDEVLKQSEEKYRLLIENNYDIIFTLNAEGIFIFVSPAWTELLGHPTDQVIGQSFQPFIHVDDILVCLEFLQKVFNTGQKQDGIEYRVKHISGEWRWYRANAVPLKDESGKVIGLQGIGRDFTESKRTEEDLRISEENFSKAFFLSPDAIMITRLIDGKFVSVNEGFKQIFGYAEEEVIGKTIPEINIWDSPEDRNRWIEKLKAEGKVVNFEARFRTKDRDIGYGLMSAAIIELNGVEHILNITRDITERKLAEDALHESQENFRTFFETVDDIIVVGTPDGNIIYSNPALSRKLGYSSDELKAKHILDLHPLEKRQEAEIIFAEMFKGERDVCPLPLAKKDGVYLPVETRVCFGKWSGLDCIYGISKDLSREQEALQKFNRLFSSNPALMAVSSFPERKFTEVNDSFLSTLGFSREDIIGKTSEELGLFTEPAIRNDLELVLQDQGCVRNVELKVRKKDGTIVDGMFSGEIIENQGQKSFLTVMLDITERKRGEEELKKALSILHSTLESTTDGILVVDSEGKMVVFNQRFVEMWQIPQNVMESRDDDKALEFVLSQLTNPEAFLEKVRELYNQPESDSSDMLQFKDGRVFERYSQPQRTGDKIVGRVWNFRDITERVQFEEDKESLRSQLLQSQKMETMGTLAMGIAHDFNNMLTVILGYSSFLLSDKNEKDPGYEGLQKIVKTAQDAADLVQRIRISGRRAEMNLVPLDLNHQVDEVTKLLSSTLPKMIEMDIHLTKAPVIIKADPSQITQMVMNLAVNANEAMPQGGRLTIQTENIMLDDDYYQSSVGVKPGPYVMLTVSDTGRGIDKGLMERIFDPFYSTKTRDYHKGTGLGLSVVQGIVQQHGGHITVESEVGKGTIFRMFFPALEHEIVPEYVETKIPYSAGGTETILLVEDMDLVRELGVIILEKFGYTVLSAGDGQEALDVYEKEQGNISLVILDILMPRMDGKECLEQLLRINPTVKVIISSGVGQEDLINEVVKLGAKGAVNKPYGMRQLLAMVRKVLDED